MSLVPDSLNIVAKKCFEMASSPRAARSALTAGSLVSVHTNHTFTESPFTRQAGRLGVTPRSVRESAL